MWIAPIACPCNVLLAESCCKAAPYGIQENLMPFMKQGLTLGMQGLADISIELFWERVWKENIRTSAYMSEL